MPYAQQWCNRHTNWPTLQSHQLWLLQKGAPHQLGPHHHLCQPISISTQPTELQPRTYPHLQPTMQQSPPATAGIPPPTYVSGGRGRGGKRGGRGRGGSGFNQNCAGYGCKPPAVGGDVAGGGGHNNPQHNNKWFANTNMCYSGGWDVPYWHISKTCPAGCRNAHHQEGCDRNNAQAYIDAGHNMRLKRKEKTV